MRFRLIVCGAASTASAALAACDGAHSTKEMAMAPPAMQSDAARSMAAEMPSVQTSVLPSAPIQRDSVVPAMIIRNGTASIEVDSLELAIENVRALAARLNGYVGNVSIASGENQIRSATLEVKVPAARFDDAMAGMKPIGKVESSNATAEDVGEEFVDVSARMANGKRLEDRLISLLTNRAGKLEEVLAVERELARVREEIERYEGRIRFLRSRVATSTLSVTVHERAPLVSRVPGTSVIGEAFADMWRNFVNFVAGLIAALGFLVPLALICVAIWLVGRRFSWWSRPHPK